MKLRVIDMPKDKTLADLITSARLVAGCANNGCDKCLKRLRITLKKFDVVPRTGATYGYLSKQLCKSKKEAL